MPSCLRVRDCRLVDQGKNGFQAPNNGAGFRIVHKRKHKDAVGGQVLIVPFERLNWSVEVIDAFVENHHIGTEIGVIGLGVCDLETGSIVAEALALFDGGRRNVNAEITLISEAG